MTEYVEQWVDGKLTLVPKGDNKAAAVGRSSPKKETPSGPDPRAQLAVPDVCGPVQQTTGNILGAPNIGVDPKDTYHPWIDAVYNRVSTIKRKLFERADARNVKDL